MWPKIIFALVLAASLVAIMAADRVVALLN
jgi:hypothetical protein